MNIPIVYEDEWLLVLDKPSGLLTIPSPKNETRTLTGILDHDSIQKGKSYRLHPCHRLDRDTSGLIIYAKGKSIQQKMMQEFKMGRVKKTYYALVGGHMITRRGMITVPIEGKRALTEYAVIQKGNGFDAVKVMPRTGRTNQIRIHFKFMGNPVLGDTKFSFRRDFKVKTKRLCLHAMNLEFVHPITKKQISLTADLPPDIDRLMKQ